MHVNDIKAFCDKVEADKSFAGKRVRVKAPEDKGGKYLSRQGKFDADKADAFVYDYDRDGVGYQIMQCRMANIPIEVEEAD